MKKLIIPPKLNEGDKLAFISISGGSAGDADMLPGYLPGKRRSKRCDAPRIEILESGVGN